MANRIKPNHPLADQILHDKNWKIADAAKHSGKSHQYIAKIAEPETMERYIEGIENWASNFGLTSDQWLDYLKRHIQEKHPRTS